MADFRPQLTQDEAIALAARYNVAEDEPALEAGRGIRAGNFSRTHLQTIYRWKTRDRGKSRLVRNTDDEIEDALRLAVAAREPRSAIAVLTGLYGVNTPVASAIATVIYPKVHTILDYRALEALGNPTADRSIPFYLSYLAYCTRLATGWRIPLRTLDQALWQWSAEQSARRRTYLVQRCRYP